jgi:hypothetical protein
MPKGEHLKGVGGVKKYPENNPTKGGRKQSILNAVWTILVDSDNEEDRHLSMSKEDKYKFIEMLMEMPFNKLKDLAESCTYDVDANPKVVDDILLKKISKIQTTMPIYMLNIITAIFQDVQEGKTTTIDKYFDRFYGKAAQVITGGTAADGTDKPIEITLNIGKEI